MFLVFAALLGTQDVGTDAKYRVAWRAMIDALTRHGVELPDMGDILAIRDRTEQLNAIRTTPEFIIAVETLPICDVRDVLECADRG